MLYLRAAWTGPVLRAGAANGDSDGATIGLAKCDPNGSFSFTSLPDGNNGVVIFDQWSDIILDSVDTVMVTVGGKTPTLMPAGNTVQSAIDSATPGDLIVIPPGMYHEMLLM